MLTKTSFILGASLLSTSVFAVVAEPKVIHGIPATATQVPWQVALYVENEQGETAHFCSGSLIAAKWVLTAAHCLEPLKDENQQLVKVQKYIAVVGEVDLTQVIRSDSAQIIDVKRNIVYPEYQSDLNLDNDIALLELETAVDLKRCGANCAVIPWLGASNAAQYSFHGSPAQVAGWGQMLSDSQKGEQDLYPSVLQVGQLTVTNCPVVNYTYNGKSWPISANMMCAVGRDRDNPADTCAGDSGSGLVVNVAAAQPFLAGITSWGEKADCGARSFSGVYTRVANYDDWILNYTDPSAYAKRQKERQQVVTSSSSGGGGGSFSVEALIGMIGLLLLRRKMVK